MRIPATILIAIIAVIGLAGCGGTPRQPPPAPAPALSAAPAPAPADDTESPGYGLEPVAGPRAEVEVEPLPPLR